MIYVFDIFSPFRSCLKTWLILYASDKPSVVGSYNIPNPMTIVINHKRCPLIVLQVQQVAMIQRFMSDFDGNVATKNYSHNN